MIYILKEDVVSSCKKGVKYASNGNVVVLIANHESVQIVEDRYGKRFPVHKNKLKIVG